ILHARVMAGCDSVRSNACGSFDEMMKLHVVIAENAWARCLPSQIRIDKWGNDGVLEILFQIQDIVGNGKLVGYTAGIPEIVQRTASAVIAPKLHRKAAVFFASLLQ